MLNAYKAEQTAHPQPTRGWLRSRRTRQSKRQPAHVTTITDLEAVGPAVDKVADEDVVDELYVPRVVVGHPVRVEQVQQVRHLHRHPARTWPHKHKRRGNRQRSRGTQKKIRQKHKRRQKQRHSQRHRQRHRRRHGDGTGGSGTGKGGDGKRNRSIPDTLGYHHNNLDKTVSAVATPRTGETGSRKCVEAADKKRDVAGHLPGRVCRRRRGRVRGPPRACCLARRARTRPPSPC